MIKIYISIFLSLYTISSVFSQDTTQINSKKSSGLIQLSGVVVSEQELNTMPYTTVYNKTRKKGVIADYYGYFSLVTQPGDTLLFSFFGYKPSSYLVPDTLRDDRYSIIHMMREDTLLLPEVEVYPWPSREQFAQAFLDLQPYDDALRRAQRQLSGESLAFVAAQLEADAGLAQSYARNQYYTQLYTNGQLPSNNLFNPYAWAKLVQDWKEGKLSRQ